MMTYGYDPLTRCWIVGEMTPSGTIAAPVAEFAACPDGAEDEGRDRARAKAGELNAQEPARAVLAKHQAAKEIR